VPDLDIRRFQNGINQTRSGLRLRLAMHEGRIAVEQIKRLQSLGGRQAALAVETWRHAYIKSCNCASQAIDTLWDEHQWPEDGARDRRFVWRPAANFRR
jgi:hypothetical protein